MPFVLMERIAGHNYHHYISLSISSFVSNFYFWLVVWNVCSYVFFTSWEFHHPNSYSSGWLKHQIIIIRFSVLVQMPPFSSSQKGAEGGGVQPGPAGLAAQYGWDEELRSLVDIARKKWWVHGGFTSSCGDFGGISTVWFYKPRMHNSNYDGEKVIL